eukprot:GHVS01032533.1.p1 GENE.GHVS01032533.1~~GHVS01032533.1.p1  ORF type:complete len:484 (-),score=17.84 GHVS01032533.1:211-1662(-)
MVSSASIDGQALDGTSSSATNTILHVRSGRHKHAEDLFKRIVTKSSELQKEAPLAGSRLYHYCISGIQFLFALCWGVSTYFNRDDELDAFICFFVLRIIFILIFIADTLLQYLAFRRFTLMFYFDSFLNLVGVVDICVSAVIIFNGSMGNLYIPHLALEVVQLFRLYRLLLTVKELEVFSTGLLHSIQSLRWAALFVLLVIYGSAIFTTWTFGHDLTDEGEDEDDMYEMWGTLVNSLFTLFTVLTLEGWNDICTGTAKYHPYSKIFFVLYICFTTLTLMNVVTGVVLDAYVETSQRMNAGKEYERILRKNKVMESLLHTAFISDAPVVKSDPESTPTGLRRQSTFSPSTSTMDTSPQTNKSARDNISLDSSPNSSECSDSDVCLSTHDPQVVLLRADVLRALSAGQVPLYLAFDVLRTYNLQGLSTVTVSEFCDGCSRMSDQATGRHLIHLEVSLKSQLNRIERQLRNLRRLNSSTKCVQFRA